jgi:nucleoside-diphosphate-sugar epimerase
VGDIRDAAAVDEAVKGCRLVFHTAALTSDWGPAKLFADINIGGTRNVCAAALSHGVRRLVHVSSFECFAHYALDRVDESSPFVPRNASYADTKIGSTEIVQEFTAKGLQTSIVYPVWVYGPLDRTLIPLLADSIRRRQLVYWAPRARMSLIYIDNLVDLLMLAATHPTAAGEGFMACDGEEMTFGGLCERLATGIGAPPPSLTLPAPVVYFLADLLEFVYRLARSSVRPVLTRQVVTLFSSRAVIDSSKARRLFGWTPRVCQEEGLRRTIGWLTGIDPSEWKKK